uniref:Rhodopsin domain-containing protein n=1 Tax=Bionectria ochroleuca TaxID=29856 RepID=A0A8H7KA19_BIOOC
MILPREHETPFNKAPVIRAVAALLMVIAIFSAVTRIVTRLLTVGAFKKDDQLVAAATVVVIAQSAAVISQGANGLGKLESLGPEQVSYILKSHYASDILYIAALLLSKVSATRTLWGMAPRERRKAIWAIEALIAAWASSSILAALFQCSLPQPWDFVHGQCFNRSIFWIYVDALNIVTDLAITGILVEMFIKLKTSTSKKILVISVFGCRIFIIPPIVSHMYYFKRIADSPNPLFDMWQPTVIVQVIQCLSIMATCIPYLKPFMDSLNSGQMAAGDYRGTRSKGSNSRSQSAYASARMSRPPRSLRGTGAGITSIATRASHRLQKYEMMDMSANHDRAGGVEENITTVTAGNKEDASNSPNNRSWDGQSHTSQTVLVQSTWRVDVEESGKDENYATAANTK